MEIITKTRELKEKITELKMLMEDFVNLHNAKKNRIENLENEIKDLKQNINKYLDDLDQLVD